MDLKKTYDYFKPFLVFISTIILISSIQWSLIQLYTSYCCHYSFEGFLNNVFNLGGPVCHFINTVQYKLSENYISLWIGAGTLLISYLSKLFK